MSIHPSAFVHPHARLEESVIVGPYCVIDEDVQIGADTVLGPNTYITGHTTIGVSNHFVAYCAIGLVPEDLKYKGEPTQLIIGDRNKFREFCTVNIGTVQDAGKTVIGSDNLIMSYVHVGHDSVLGSKIVLANSVQLAGHVVVEDSVTIGSMTGVTQFLRIGQLAMVGGASHLMHSVPPFTKVRGYQALAQSINLIGLQRSGYHSDDILMAKKLYRILFSPGAILVNTRAAIAEIAEEHPFAQKTYDFLCSIKGGIVRSRTEEQ